jgi:D-sedoheptulose 7-phosphate isomerase
MTEHTAIVRRIFAASAALKSQCAVEMSEKIAAAAMLLVSSLKNGGKILTCGNGGSAADAQHFSSEMLNRFDRDRAGFAAVALTTDASTLTSIANDYSYAEIFAKQVSALAKPHDTLLAFTTSGNSTNIERAISAAHKCAVPVVLLSGKDGGSCASALSASDLELRVPHYTTARIQETHLTIIHCLCELIDAELLGEPR